MYMYNSASKTASLCMDNAYIISLRATEVVARQGKRGTSDPWMGSANAPVISKRIRLGFRDTCLKGTINDVFSALI